MYIHSYMCIDNWCDTQSSVPIKRETFVQSRSNVEDVWPTLYKWYTNVLCLLGTPNCQYGPYLCQVLWPGSAKSS